MPDASGSNPETAKRLAVVEQVRQKPAWALAILTLLGTIVAAGCWVTSVPTGPIRIEIEFPPQPANGVEPIVTTGIKEHADFFLVNYLEPGKLRFGYDSWFAGGPFSDNLSVKPGKTHVLVLDMPSLHVDYNAAHGKLLVAIDGKKVIDATVSTHFEAKTPIYVGSQPISGTGVAAVFSGKIVRYTRIREFSTAVVVAALQLRGGAIITSAAVAFALSLLIVLAAQRNAQERRRLLSRVWRSLTPATGSPDGAAQIAGDTLPGGGWDGEGSGAEVPGRSPLSPRVLVYLSGLAIFIAVSTNRSGQFTLLETNLESQASLIGTPARHYLESHYPPPVWIGCVSGDPASPLCNYLVFSMLPYNSIAVSLEKRPLEFPYLVFIGDPRSAEKPAVQAAHIANYRVAAPLNEEAVLLVRSNP